MKLMIRCYTLFPGQRTFSKNVYNVRDPVSAPYNIDSVKKTYSVIENFSSLDWKV